MYSIKHFSSLCAETVSLPIYKFKEQICFSGFGEVTHITYYKCGNVGDTVLSQCVRRTLEILCGIKSWNLIPVDRVVDEKLIKTINHSKLLLIGGGGLFLPDSNYNSISGWQWAISSNQLSSIQCPIVIYSVGYNYFRGQFSNNIFENSVNNIIEQSAFVGLRNLGSIKAINNLLQKSSNKLIYQPCTTTLIRKIFPTLPPKTETQNVAFNVAFDREELRYGKDKIIILKQISYAMKSLLNMGYNIYYLAHCYNDLEFIKFIGDILKKIKIIDMSEWYPHSVYQLYNKMDCVIGMRGHAQMIPFGLNCEIISLGSHEKMKWFLQDINATDWYIELREEPNTISDRIIQLFNNIHCKKNTKQRLIDSQDLLWENTLHNAFIINKIINKSC